ncbi:aldehyde dehydrogenase [Paenibacillus sp. JX-17]|uniref:Aldehyde dehydrogenase n=1 Tax=Paenibacillus lacisoli TaxID=3064525 RepID=A0ABT9CF13_9BACL|nr:aldehyde dehydrogenase [Paenibacillus sp. JX-17]MDO7906281.1 aldehyde dehydrogenase [Paenibacillus sp. JX-17]
MNKHGRHPGEWTPPEIEGILAAQKNYFGNRETLDIDFRLRQLNKLRQAILDYEDRLNEALMQDLGKSAFESYATEIGFVLNSIRHTMKHLRSWSKPKRVRTPLVLFPSSSKVMYEPYGSVLIIAPFNYPFQLLIEPLAGAMAAGNCAVVKPSEIVPHVSAVLSEMIGSTFDPAYIRCVEGGVETNTSLIHAPFDYIFFTGSVAVGRIVMEAAARHLVPVTLELGGKSPAIVDQTADLRAAAERIIWGKTLNAGQTCVAPDYLLVHASVKEKLLTEMKQTLVRFYGTSMEDSADYGRIVSDRHWTRLRDILEQDRGGIRYGGSMNPETRYLEPTLLEAAWESASMQDEIFGPILPILTFERLDEVIASVNGRPKPLALYLFTEDLSVEQRVLAGISAGGVSVNDTITHLANPELPFGGVGSSGIGSYHGHRSFVTFSHEKSILKKNSRIRLQLLFPPYTPKKQKFIRRMMK